MRNTPQSEVNNISTSLDVSDIIGHSGNTLTYINARTNGLVIEAPSGSTLATTGAASSVFSDTIVKQLTIHGDTHHANGSNIYGNFAFQGNVSFNGTTAFQTEGFNELSIHTSLRILNGVYAMNNAKATFLRDVELQNLTSQNVFTKKETDGRYALKNGVYRR